MESCRKETYWSRLSLFKRVPWWWFCSVWGPRVWEYQATKRRRSSIKSMESNPKTCVRKVICMFSTTSDGRDANRRLSFYYSSSLVVSYYHVCTHLIMTPFYRHHTHISCTYTITLTLTISPNSMNVTITTNTVYCKKALAGRVQGTQILDVACGVGNVLTNKGAVMCLVAYTRWVY